MSFEENTQERSGIYEWEKALVLISYTGGPEPSNPFELKEGSLEAQSGIFGLHEVSSLGVMAQKLTLSEESEPQLEEPMFIPWGSINSMKSFSAVFEVGDNQEGSEEESESE